MVESLIPILIIGICLFVSIAIAAFGMVASSRKN